MSQSIRRLLFLLFLLFLLLLPLSLVLAMTPAPASPGRIPVADNCGDTCDKESDPSVFVAGELAAYHLTVTNTGSSILTSGITMTDFLPAGLEYRSAGGSGWQCFPSPDLPLVYCSYSGSLAPGASTTVDLNVLVTEEAGPGVSNRAEFGLGGITYEDTVRTPVLKRQGYLPLIRRE